MTSMQVARPWLCCCAMSGMFVACLYMLPKSIRALHRDSTEQVCYTQTTRTPQHARTRDGQQQHSETVDLSGLARQPHAGSAWHVLGRMHLGTLAPIDSRLLLTSPSLPTPHPHRASRCVIDSSSPLAHNPDQGKDRRPHGHMCRDPCVAVHVRVPRGTRTLRGGWREGWGGCVGLAVAKHGAASAPYINYGVWFVLWCCAWCCALCIALFSSTWCQGGMALPCCGVVSLPPTLWLVLLSLLTLLSLYTRSLAIFTWRHRQSTHVIPPGLPPPRLCSSIHSIHSIHAYTHTLVHSYTPYTRSLLPLLLHSLSSLSFLSSVSSLHPPPPPPKDDPTKGEGNEETRLSFAAWLGFRFDGLVAALTLPLLLTMSLFIGPIAERIVEYQRRPNKEMLLLGWHSYESVWIQLRAMVCVSRGACA